MTVRAIGPVPAPVAEEETPVDDGAGGQPELHAAVSSAPPAPAVMNSRRLIMDDPPHIPQVDDDESVWVYEPPVTTNPAHASGNLNRESASRMSATCAARSAAAGVIPSRSAA